MIENRFQLNSEEGGEKQGKKEKEEKEGGGNLF
jgi:hypothetical protein